MSSPAWASSISAISNQWYGSAPDGADAVHEGRNGGDSTSEGSVSMFLAFPSASARFGGGGGGAQPLGSILVSWWMRSRKEPGCSHGGGTMLARRCFFKTIASHSGRSLRRGGRKEGVGPCKLHAHVSTTGRNATATRMVGEHHLRRGARCSRDAGVEQWLQVPFRKEKPPLWAQARPAEEAPWQLRRCERWVLVQSKDM